MMIRKEEKGALTVEATVVFPVIFFVLLFLIYMGNMFYMRSQVDAIVAKSAIQAASYCADPYLETIEKSGKVPREIDNVHPYHTLLGSEQQASAVRKEMDKKLNQLGTGFFSGMGIRNVRVNQFSYNKGMLVSTFVVDVSYSIQFPIRFMGDNSPVILQINSRTVAPVTDTGEFIQNVDMAMDFYDSSGLSEKLSLMVDKIKSFLGN